MRSRLFHAALAVSVLGVFGFSLSASARDIVLPAGTLLQCTLNEPNFSSSTVDVGDPVLCHLRGVTEFGQQAFPRGSYWSDISIRPRIRATSGARVISRSSSIASACPPAICLWKPRSFPPEATKSINRARSTARDTPSATSSNGCSRPLWPWKVIMLPARGPRPKLKGETVLSLRLMDDVQIPQVAKTFGPNWHFFSRDQSQNYQPSVYDNDKPQLVVPERFGRGTVSTPMVTGQVQASYASVVTRTLPATCSRHARLCAEHRHRARGQRIRLSRQPHQLFASRRGKRRDRCQRYRLDFDDAPQRKTRCTPLIAQ